MSADYVSRFDRRTIEIIINLRAQGLGNRIITREVGLPRHTVCVLLRKLGYDAKRFTPETRGRRAFPQETIDLVLQRRKEGVSNRGNRP